MLEKVAPAVVHETIEPTQHEDVQTVVDKEIHQDHYHTSVQPIADKVILPEQHTHNLVAVEERTVEHGDKRDVEARLAAEAGKFQNERIVTAAEHTHSVAPVIAGEHIHHHVHETIQPVVQRGVSQSEQFWLWSYINFLQKLSNLASSIQPFQSTRFTTMLPSTTPLLHSLLSA